MTLVKTSMLSAVATLIKILSGFIITKVIAIYIGPSGLAIIGQLQNFIMLVKTVAGDFLKTAITKYTAEYENDENKKYDLWSSSFKLAFVLNFVVLVGLIYFSNDLSYSLFHTLEYAFVFKILAISLPFFVSNTILLAILNGQKQIKQYIFLNIVLSIVSLFIVVVLSVLYEVEGALVAYVVSQAIVFFITLIYLRKETWLKLKLFLFSVRKENIKKLLGFAIITLSAVLASNTSMIYIRNYISDTYSMSDAGYWQGVWLLSQVALSLITTSLATYFLPTLSVLTNKKALNKELTNAIYIIIPIAIVISLSMYFLREYIIIVLYSDQFMPMSQLFLWQMVGNVIKVLGWLFGYVLVAKAMVKYTVTTEILFAVIFIVSSIYFMRLYGLVGVTYAYAMSSLLHLIVVSFIYKFKVD